MRGDDLSSRTATSGAPTPTPISSSSVAMGNKLIVVAVPNP
jgi:hypothetical protein